MIHGGELSVSQMAQAAGCSKRTILRISSNNLYERLAESEHRPIQVVDLEASGRLCWKPFVITCSKSLNCILLISGYFSVG